eukprot:5159381-Amphidinium_carterae.1
MVTCLSWNFMGRPSKGFKAEVMCLELSAVQRSALDLLARWVVACLDDLGGYGKTDISHPAGKAECSSMSTVAYAVDAQNARLPACSALVSLDRALPVLYAGVSVERALAHNTLAT